ncbi:rhodanese-like domain-containing protein [Psychromonas aquimarina]|uniref:rhodanese-like domain-containing protein n=1 Tax=Psychromonas aquimarina TaxID=444919 RepID=UPI00041E884F|nr:rhodanese-like domain-containing protein [Psychromonas aquimarina]
MKLSDTIKIIPLLLCSLFAQSKVMQIEPSALLEQIKKQQAPILLDVRTAREFTQGHIQGAVNIPYDQLLNQMQKIKDYKEQEIVIYCRSGRRAQVAADILKNKGFKHLSDLDGHMLLWQELNYPLISTPQ